jgi:putative MATE family efflux protein
MGVERAVWTVAWPMVTIGVLRSCYYLTDSFWIGKLGTTHLAALGGSAFAWWMMFIACNIAGYGVNALVARHEGAGSRESIAPSMTQGLWAGLILYLLLLAFAWPLRDLYFQLLGFEMGSEEHLLGAEYIGIGLLGCVALAAHAVTLATFRGIGDTRTALWITAISLVLNAVLDPILIWGWLGAPALGIGGAAWATTSANAVSAVLGAIILARKGYRIVPRMPRIRSLRVIARIGVPIAAEGIGFSMVYVILGQFINDFGTHQMAALGVGHRLEGLAFMVCMGFQVAASTLVGQYLGARDPNGAARAVHRAAALCVAVVLPMAVALYVFAPHLFSVFTDDPATVAAGVLYLRIQAVVAVFMAMDVVYQGGFSGSGNTLPALVIGLSFTVLRIPLAWLLAYPAGLGIDGVWWAVALSTTIKGILCWLWFRRGRWTEALSAEDLEV